MPGMTRPATARPQEEALLGRPRRAALLTAGVLALTAVVFALVADHGTLARIQRLDDAWLRLMISGRASPLTAIAKVFNVLGLVYVTLPVRILLAGSLVLRRRWWHLAAFASAIVLSEVLIGSLKGIYDRTRPPGSLVATSGASFPSGHAIAASVTVVAAVIALVPPGRRRALWGAAAVAFSIVMGLSRAYLGAHWLSDATAGILLGTSCALVTALVADQFQRRQNTDKTGTLTLNQMTAVQMVAAGHRYAVEGKGYSTHGRICRVAGQAEIPLDQFLMPMVLASGAVLSDGELIGDPTEGALVALAAKGGIDAVLDQAGTPENRRAPLRRRVQAHGDVPQDDR